MADKVGYMSVIEASGAAIPLRFTDNGDGTYSLSSAANLAAGENHLGALGGHTVQIDAGITVDTAVYTSGDVLGGKLTLTNAMRVSGGSGILQSLFIQDSANQKPVLEILIFNADPSAGTYTDNAAFTYTAADRAKCIRRISVAATDYVTVGGVAIADLSPGGRALVASGSRNLYAVCVLASAPDFVAASDLIVKFGILQD